MHRRIAVLAILVSGVALNQSRGQSAPPGTDIYLATFAMSHANGRTIGIGDPQNITHRIGYDNQPAFLDADRGLYYTSIRADGQADIYRYDIATHATTRVTSTPESEYSATYMPNGRFSVVRVEPDSTQRLWSFALDGSDPRLVVRSVKPVGYHVWLDSNHVALYVLGKPATLQIAELPSERVDTAARDIGRSLSPVGLDVASFVQPRAGGGFTLHEVRLDRSGRQQVRSLGALPDSAEYVVWLDGGAALTASGSTLYIRQPGARSWDTLADFGPQGIRHITRLAISGGGRWLAFAADDPR
jgi:hypothetical protein